MSDRFLSDKQVGEMTGLGRTKRWHLERANEFPRRRRISEQRVAWLESEVLEWMRSREVGAPPAPAKALAARGITSPEAR